MSEDLKLALFDYDGTIVDSAIMIVQGAIEAFRMCGLPDPDPKKVRENIGKPLAIALDEYMPPGFNVTPEQISDAYRSWYAEQGRLGLQNEPLYPGLVKLLSELKENNWLIGVATNKSRIGLTNDEQCYSLQPLSIEDEGRLFFLRSPFQRREWLSKRKVPNEILGNSVHNVCNGNPGKIVK